jgi:hypothetical protein
MPYAHKRITPNSRSGNLENTMQTAMNMLEPRSTYQAWGGFRSVQPDVWPTRGMWKDTVLVTNSEGRTECFAIGPDGFVWSFEMGDADHGTGRLVSTGLSGATFSLGVAGDGLLVVLAAEGNKVSCAMEMYEDSQRWSAPVAIDFPGQPEGMTVDKVITQTRGDNLFIGFIMSQQMADGSTQRRLWEAVWAGTRPVLAAGPVAMACGHAFWLDKLEG